MMQTLFKDKSSEGKRVLYLNLLKRNKKGTEKTKRKLGQNFCQKRQITIKRNSTTAQKRRLRRSNPNNHLTLKKGRPYVLQQKSSKMKTQIPNLTWTQT